MRIVLIAAFLIAMNVCDTRAQSVSDPVTPVIFSQSSHANVIQKRRRSGTEKPKVDVRLRSEIFASQLGDISAMTMDAQGTLFVADQTRGRILRLQDRALDGRMDMRRVIASGFEDPSGLAVIGERLFIADARAVWETSLTGGTVKQVADLSLSHTLPHPRHLWPSSDGQSLILAVSSEAQGPQSKIVYVNIDTGQASLIAQGEGIISAMAVGLNDLIWIGIDNQILPVSHGTFRTDRAQTFAPETIVTGLSLPGQFGKILEALQPWEDHILVSQGGGLRPGTGPLGGLNVLAIPTRFGQPTDGTEIFAGGFTDRFKRSAWGQPGTLFMDPRGLFITDRWSGVIWLIQEALPLLETSSEAESAEVEAEIPSHAPESPPLRPSGSSITQGTSIGYGTSIEKGSKIPKGEKQTYSDEETKRTEK